MSYLVIKNKIKNTALFHKIKKLKVYQKIRHGNKQALLVYLTFQCTLNCAYCTNRFNPKESKMTYKFLPAEQWVDAINKTGRDIILTGGEPTLHPEITKIINGIDKKIKIMMYTNFCWKDGVLDKFVKEVKRPVQFYVSYHVGSGDPKRVINTMNTLRDHNLFDGVVHTIETDQNKEFLKKVYAEFKKNGWNLEIDKDQFTKDYPGSSMKFRQTVRCEGERLYVAPDGNVYPCVSKLLRKSKPIKNIFKDDLKEKYFSLVCEDFGYCLPCDCEEVNKVTPIKRDIIS
jgi:MoaA/NifB/PqqE/SkfB family radical SAM enzyme